MIEKYLGVCTIDVGKQLVRNQRLGHAAAMHATTESAVARAG